MVPVAPAQKRTTVTKLRTELALKSGVAGASRNSHSCAPTTGRVISRSISFGL